MNTKQLSQSYPSIRHNFVTNGNFDSWSLGNSIEYDTGEPVFFADGWFGRRGNFDSGLVVSQQVLEGTNSNLMRVARKAGNDSSSEIGVAQVVTLSNECDLAGKTISLSMNLRAGAKYSHPKQQLSIYVLASSDTTDNELNPFTLGKKSQTIGLLKAKLKPEFDYYSLIVKVPADAKQIMLVLRTLELSDAEPATTDDFFDVMNVSLTAIDDLPTTSQKNLVPIIHVASMARSGETVFLRSLNAHPQIYNLVNLKDKDNEDETQLFRFLQHYELKQIDRAHPLMENLKLKPNQTLLVKQGVWEHKYPFNGVVLVRNPISVYASMISYNASSKEEFKARKKALTRNCKRWLRDIDNQLLDSFDSLNVIEQFCAFYNRRMYPLSQLGLPIVHYEEFCLRPEPYLKAVLSSLSLRYKESVAQSHLNYSEEQTGHGLIQLAEPINPKSLNKWQKHISENEFNIITALTYNTWNAFGYEITWPNISVKQDALLA